MSTWYEIKKERISLSDDKKTLQILVTNDDCGNIYAEVSIEDIKEFLKENK